MEGNGASGMAVADVQALLQADDIEDKEAVSEPASGPAEPDGNPLGGPAYPVLIPAEIYSELREDAFLCWDTGAWQYTPQGILACGRWESDDASIERDLLFPHDRIIAIELLFEAVAKMNEAGVEAALAEAQVQAEQEEPDGDEAAAVSPSD